MPMSSGARPISRSGIRKNSAAGQRRSGIRKNSELETLPTEFLRIPLRERRLSSWIALLALVFLILPGCVQRRLTVRSNPPGALVYVGNELIGSTPVSTDYIYYGAREIRLEKDGFETLTVLQEIPPPYYQFVPLDFVAENIIPWEIRDERALDFQLRPQLIVPNEELLGRADELRRGSRIEQFVPATPPAGIGPIRRLPPVPSQLGGAL
jgi:hypothetical protein